MGANWAYDERETGSGLRRRIRRTMITFWIFVSIIHFAGINIWGSFYLKTLILLFKDEKIMIEWIYKLFGGFIGVKGYYPHFYKLGDWV